MHSSGSYSDRQGRKMSGEEVKEEWQPVQMKRGFSHISRSHWGLRRNCREPNYLLTENDFDVNMFKGRFVLHCESEVPKYVEYRVTDTRIDEKAFFGRGSTLITKYTIDPVIKKYVEKNEDPEKGIVAFCYAFSLAKKELAVEQMKKFLNAGLVPPCYAVLSQEENATYKGPFPSYCYTSDFDLRETNFDKYYNLIRGT